MKTRSQIQNDECEIEVHGKWTLISIDEGVRLGPDVLKRCPACHGRMRAHKKSETGAKAHFEHIFLGGTACPRMGIYFTGPASMHSEPLE